MPWWGWILTGLGVLFVTLLILSYVWVRAIIEHMDE